MASGAKAQTVKMISGAALCKVSVMRSEFKIVTMVDYTFALLKRHFNARSLVVAVFVLIPTLLNHSFASDPRGSVERYLFEVIRLDQYDRLEDYINKHPEVVRREFRGRTVLNVAARSGKYSLVKLLLERGADPNQSAEETALRAALSLPYLKFKSPFRSDREKASPDEIEVVREYLKSISILLEYGADYKYSEMFKTDGGAIYEIWKVEHIVSTVCYELSFVNDFLGDIADIALRIDGNELEKLNRSVLVMYQASTGLLSRECVGLFGVELPYSID